MEHHSAPILLIDSDPEFAYLIRRYAERSGYLIAEAIERGMYFYLTPIVAWDFYVTLPGRFSDPTWGTAITPQTPWLSTAPARLSIT